MIWIKKQYLYNFILFCVRREVEIKNGFNGRECNLLGKILWNNLYNKIQ